ncbi:cytochrome P450 [Microbacterium radiodurans]|uniref:Cytochrome P450 n=1 Tax=Microbacterium radiodurans TaxID=661398 RepID=A0A5J5IT29_9MICO|nr:cytochrome P450 [Microbacterium radiodurans]KAA9085169.1 cytochrome P450 [Microbacterium radiodurans]
MAPTLRSHADVVAAALDVSRFSNDVSRFRQVPNGLDATAHRQMVEILAPFLAPDVVDGLEPTLRAIARQLIAELAARPAFDAVGDLGVRFAVRAQSAWLGWSPEHEPALRLWVAEHRAALRSGEDHRIAATAARFDDIVRLLLDERRGCARDDLTTRLLRLRAADGDLLPEADVVSILRNWTGGDLSSLALCVGVVVHWLADDGARAARLRDAAASDLDAVIDEILRLDDPFVSNRRRALTDAVVGGCPVHAGDVVVLDWRAANTDATVFGPGFDPHAHAAANLVYGVGPHACPGRMLATRQLRVLVQELLGAGAPQPAAGDPAVRESAPGAGWRTMPVRLVRDDAAAAGRAS